MNHEWILRELEVERELLGRVKSLKLGYYGHMTRKYDQATEVVVDNADVGRTTSSSGQGWRLMKQQDRLRIEIVGEESYAPPTLHQKEGIERRRRIWGHSHYEVLI